MHDVELDPIRWEALRHAYGVATDIPALLRDLEAAEAGVSFEIEPWHSLWSALCHQDDAFSASYAALPHLVELAARSSGEKKHHLIHFASYIDMCRSCGKADPMPEGLAPANEIARVRLRRLVLDALEEQPTETQCWILVAAAASLAGHPALGHALINADDLRHEVEGAAK